MQILVHAVHLPVSDSFPVFAEERIEDVLARFADKLTRVEVHITDENAQKGGVDIRCLIEARPRGLPPMTAEHRGEGVRETFSGALAKMEKVLEHDFSKRATKRRPT
ncbi:MAG: HPF/RaiA family ribosome-associated protein [Planctomycetota bacterium]